MKHTAFTINPTITTLLNARTALETDWCQERFGRDGEVCLQQSLYSGIPNGTYHRAHAYVQCAIGYETGIIAWNDTPGRTKDEVIAAIDRAISIAMSEVS